MAEHTSNDPAKFGLDGTTSENSVPYRTSHSPDKNARENILTPAERATD
jgi:hypothetical protein